MKITEFTKQLYKRGISRPYNFDLELTIPSKLINSEWYKEFNINSDIINILNFQCISTSFPSTNIKEIENIYKIPSGKSFDDLSLDIRCGKDLMEKKFFDAWNLLIVNQDNYIVSYLDDITTTLKLIKKDIKGNILQTIQYIDAYPKTVSGLAADHESNKIDVFKVEMSYRKWKFI